MIRAYYKDNPQQYKDFENFLFLFPSRHNLSFDFGSDTIFIDGEAFQLSRIEFISKERSELDSRYERLNNKNQPNGYAGLDSEAKIPAKLLPAIRVVDVHVVQNLDERNNLQNIDEGDLAVVTNENKTYVWTGEQWLEIKAQGNVLSVDGHTGTVTLSDLYAAIDHKHTSIQSTQTDQDETVIQTVDGSAASVGEASYGYTKITVTEDTRINALKLGVYKTGTGTQWTDLHLEVKINDNVIVDTNDATSVLTVIDDRTVLVNLPEDRQVRVGDTIEVILNCATNCIGYLAFHVEAGYNAVVNSNYYSRPYTDETFIYSLVYVHPKAQVTVENGEVRTIDQYGDFVVNQEINELQATLQEHDNRITQNSNSINELQSSVEDIDGRVNQNEGKISDLQSAIEDVDFDKLQNDIYANKEGLQEHENRISQNSESINELQSSVEDMDGRVSQNEGKISDLQSAIEDVDFDKLQNDIYANKEGLQEHENRISQNSESINELQSSVEDMDGRVSQNESSIANIQTTIEQILQRLQTVEDCCNNQSGTGGGSGGDGGDPNIDPQPE